MVHMSTQGLTSDSASTETGARVSGDTAVSYDIFSICNFSTLTQHFMLTECKCGWLAAGNPLTLGLTLYSSLLRELIRTFDLVTNRVQLVAPL